MTGQVTESVWTASEQWAWGEIVAGRTADFAAEHGELDPGARKGWRDDRTLSAAFLRAILFEKKWTDQVPIDGVCISGARWSEGLALAHAQLERPLCLEKCRFEKPVDLAGLRTEGRLSFRGSAFNGAGGERGLILDRATARRADLSGGIFRKGFAAAGAVFDGVLDLNGAAIEGRLDLDSAKVRCLLLRNGSAGEIALPNCEVEQDVDFSGSTVSGTVKMADCRIGQDVWLAGSEDRPASFRNGIALQGALVGGSVSLCGADVGGPVRMNGMEVKKNLFMRAPLPADDIVRKGKTLFAGRIDLTFAQIHGYFELLGGTFEGSLDMSGLRVGENLSGWGTRSNPTLFRKVLLSSARIKGDAEFGNAHFRGEAQFGALRVEGNLSLSGCHFDDTLNLADARIGGHFFMKHARGTRPRCKGAFVLQSARIGGQFEFTGRCDGAFTSSGLQVDLNLFLGGVSRGTRTLASRFRATADLRYANVKGALYLGGAIFETGLAMSGIEIGQEFVVRATFGKATMPGKARTDQVPGASATTEAKAEIRPVLDLSASKIGGQLCLDLPLRTDKNGKDTRLDLRDAKAGSLQVFGPKATLGGWPQKGSVQLDGFTYDRLGGFGVNPDQEMMARDVAWFNTWLALDEPYSPQPYEHLATVLRQAGETEKASSILYESRERVREAAGKALGLRARLRWLGLTLLKRTIGYGIGYGYFRALIPAAILTLIGVYVLGAGPTGAAGGVQLTSWLDKLVYSFDQLLPIVGISGNLSDVRLPDSVEHYFYFHRALGFLLGSFIAAGIAGLTQRSRS